MSLVYFVILIGVLIFVHELGHFLAAKAFGVGVQKFSLGFGPRMVGFRWGETEYQVCWLPLGGFVKMVGDEATREVPEEDRHRAFNGKPGWQRFLIALAGPFFNLLLPVGLFLAVFLSHDRLTPAVVGTVIPGSPAAVAGMRAGDRIVEIDGRPIKYFYRLQEVVGGAANRPLTVTFEREGTRHTVRLVPTEEVLREPPGLERRRGRIGVSPLFLGPRIGVVSSTSPAARAGLRSFDLVTAMDGKPVKRWIDIEKTLARDMDGKVHLTGTRETSGGPPVPVEADLLVPPGSTPASLGIFPGENVVARVEKGSPAWVAGLREGDLLVSVDGQPCVLWEVCERNLLADPASPHTVGYVSAASGGTGVKVRPLSLRVEKARDEFRQEVLRPVFGATNRSDLRTEEPVPNEERLPYALRGAVEADAELVRMTLAGFGLLLRGKISASTLGGPITIYDVAGKAGAQGWEAFLRMMALISVNLGIINLFPIPILDGGHLLFVAIEGVIRRPVPLKARVVSMYVGLALLAALMVFAFKNDLQRYWSDIIGFFGG